MGLFEDAFTGGLEHLPPIFFYIAALLTLYIDSRQGGEAVNSWFANAVSLGSGLWAQFMETLGWGAAVLSGHDFIGNFVSYPLSFLFNITVTSFDLFIVVLCMGFIMLAAYMLQFSK